MGDMTSDYQGKAWYQWHNGSESKSWVVTDTEEVNKGEVCGNTSGEALPFDVADSHEIIGVSMSNETTGNTANTNRVKVYSLFTLLSCYLSGVVVTDVEAPVWAGGADPGCSSSSGDLALAYMTGGKLLGFVRKYKTTDRADVFVDPKRLTRTKRLIAMIAGVDNNVPALNAFFGITADMGENIVVRGISYLLAIKETVTKGFTVVAVAAGTVLAGNLVIVNADTVHEEKEAAVTDSADCYLAAGGEFKFKVSALEGGGASDAGKYSFFVEYDRVPECGGFLN
jgi:hypothetical protein